MNFFIWSKKSIFPLTEWPSLYHFRITSSDSTSAVTNTAVNNQVFWDMTPCKLTRSYCFCHLNSSVLESTDSDNKGREGRVLVHFDCDAEEYMQSASFLSLSLKDPKGEIKKTFIHKDRLETFITVGWEATWQGHWHPTFQDSLTVSSSRVTTHSKYTEWQ